MYRYPEKCTCKSSILHQIQFFSPLSLLNDRWLTLTIFILGRIQSGQQFGSVLPGRIVGEIDIDSLHGKMKLITRSRTFGKLDHATSICRNSVMLYLYNLWNVVNLWSQQWKFLSSKVKYWSHKSISRLQLGLAILVRHHPRWCQAP